MAASTASFQEGEGTSDSDDTLEIADEYQDAVTELVRVVGLKAEDALRELESGKTVAQVAMEMERQKLMAHMEGVEKERERMEVERKKEKERIEMEYSRIEKERQKIEEEKKERKKAASSKSPEIGKMDLGDSVRRKERSVKKESAELMDLMGDIQREMGEIKSSVKEGARRDKESRERSRARKSVSFKTEPRSPSASSDVFVDAVDGMYVEDHDELDAPDASSTPASTSPATVSLTPMKHNNRFSEWCWVSAQKLKASTASVAIKRAAILEALQGTKAFVLARPLVEDSSLVPVQILRQLAEGELSEWVYKNREPKWKKWDPTSSLRAHTTVLLLERDDSGADEDSFMTGFLSSISGAPQSIATERQKADPTMSTEELMASLVKAVENDVTDADLDILEATVQQPTETTDQYAQNIYEAASRILLAQNPSTTIPTIQQTAKRIFLRGLRGETGERTRNAFPQTWDHALLISRQAEAKYPATTATIAPAAYGRGGGGGGRGRGYGNSNRGRGGGRGRGAHRGRGRGGGYGRGGGTGNSGGGQSTSGMDIICRGCGNAGHIVRNCPDKVRKCYSCDSPDHLIANCPTKNTSGSAPSGGAAGNAGNASQQ